jgi:hypothetical protein
MRRFKLRTCLEMLGPDPYLYTEYVWYDTDPQTWF